MLTLLLAVYIGNLSFQMSTPYPRAFQLLPYFISIPPVERGEGQVHTPAHLKHSTAPQLLGMKHYWVLQHAWRRMLIAQIRQATVYKLAGVLFSNTGDRGLIPSVLVFTPFPCGSNACTCLWVTHGAGEGPCYMQEKRRRFLLINCVFQQLYLINYQMNIKH